MDKVTEKKNTEACPVRHPLLRQNWLMRIAFEKS